MKDDPTRLSAGTDELASSIVALRNQLPSDERLAALAARLTSAGAPVELDAPPPSSVVPKSAQPKLELVPARKLLDPGALAVIVALVVGGLLIAAAISLRASDVPLTPPAVTPQALGTALPAGSPLADPGTEPPGTTTPRATPESPMRIAEGTGASGEGAPPGVEGTATGATASPAQPDAPASAPSPGTAPAGGAKAANPSSPSPTPSSARRQGTSRLETPGAEGAPLSGEAVVESEVELLKKARSALNADPLQAFALTEQCRGHYPNGSFAQEREYIAIVALSRVGRVDDARARASLFRMHYKNSAYLPQLARILGEE
jgi:hypothetical protein